jgi:hypothetical protein
MLIILIWDFSAFKVYKVCINWNTKEVIESTCTVQQWKKMKIINHLLYKSI